MNSIKSKLIKALPWVVVYLWSVPAALLLSDFLNWQYDGDPGWWIVAAYASPIMALTEPFAGYVSIEDLAIGYFVLLCTLTIFVFRRLASDRRD
jgi:hypothetical protein